MPKLKDVAPSVRVGRGFTRHNLTVFPLLATGDILPSEYTPVGIAIRTGTGKVTEISEAGSVPRLAIDNLGILPILIIDGEELIGARQNRIANVTVLAPGKKTIPIPVSCVERGRWGYQSGTGRPEREFADSPQVMYHAARASKSRDVTEALSKHGIAMANQAGVWHSIGSMQSMMGFISPTESMHDVYDNQKAHIDEYLLDVAPVNGQIGAIFAINGQPVGVELFDSGETLATYLPKIMRSYALDALANQVKLPSVADDKEATRLLNSILDLETRSFPSIGLGEDLRIESNEITGGALTYEGRVIHLAAFNTAIARN